MVECKHRGADFNLFFRRSLATNWSTKKWSSSHWPHGSSGNPVSYAIEVLAIRWNKKDNKLKINWLKKSRLTTITKSAVTCGCLTSIKCVLILNFAAVFLEIGDVHSDIYRKTDIGEDCRDHPTLDFAGNLMNQMSGGCEKKASFKYGDYFLIDSCCEFARFPERRAQLCFFFFLYFL
jgi:hypothetical protein